MKYIAAALITLLFAVYMHEIFIVFIVLAIVCAILKK